MVGYTELHKWPSFMLQVLTDEFSYTTYENIQNAVRHIRYVLKEEKVQITIFCEAQRALKVSLLARHFMRDLVKDVDDLRVETVNWERANPVRELKTTVLTWLAIKFPLLGIAERESRRRRHRAKEI